MTLWSIGDSPDRSKLPPAARSVIPAMLFHGGTNVIGRYFQMETDVVAGAPDFFVLRGVVYWVIAIVLLVTTLVQLGLKREAV